MANHASHAALPYPIKGARFTLGVPYLDADGDPTDPTTPDTEVSKDDAAAADTTEEVASPKNSVGMLTLTGDETNCSLLTLAAKATSGPKTTLATLYPRVLGIVTSGTAQAGAAGTITLQSTAPGIELAGCIVKTTGGTGGAGGSGSLNNQARVITAYNGSTKVATVVPNWETTPDSTTTYEILLPAGMVLQASRAVNPDTLDGRLLTLEPDGMVQASVEEWLGTVPATPTVAGVPEVDLTHVAGSTTNVSALATNVNTLVTRITSTLFAGITSLAQWLGAMAGKQTADATAQTEIRATGAGSGTFTATTDALEALRDRGDAAWITATGFSTHSAADVWAVGTRTLTSLGDGSGLTAIPWNAAWDAEVESEVNDALVANHLDHLLAATYDPASKPGAADALLNELVENDGGVSRFTANALEQAPSGGAGSDVVLIVGGWMRSGSTYYVTAHLVVNGVRITSGLSLLTIEFYDEDGTDLGYGGTPAESSGFINASGTLTTAVTDNKPVTVIVGVTYNAVAYTFPLMGGAVA